ncbi:hypothetical protein PHET_12213 [Paragonimus heterotremus]|uniref:Uncharacterized protein n=1 Tax=Paragonimus heterotremus TaxID=100268 RepID=A0A8J4T058_9TREM|nr:hypothetical protein PHET_12213 [Paragonimus heterotremus]
MYTVEHTGVSSLFVSSIVDYLHIPAAFIHLWSHFLQTGSNSPLILSSLTRQSTVRIFCVYRSLFKAVLLNIPSNDLEGTWLVHLFFHIVSCLCVL